MKNATGTLNNINAGFFGLVSGISNRLEKISRQAIFLYCIFYRAVFHHITFYRSRNLALILGVLLVANNYSYAAVANDSAAPINSDSVSSNHGSDRLTPGKPSPAVINRESPAAPTPDSPAPANILPADALQSHALQPNGTPSESSAAEASQRKNAVAENAKPGSATQLTSVALGLVLIVLLILALGWLMRRLNHGGLLNNSAIKIVAALSLGTRERLVVVDVAGQQLLLGITATNINTLHVFNEPVIDGDIHSAKSSEFGRKLMAVLQQKSTQEPTKSPQNS